MFSHNPSFVAIGNKEILKQKVSATDFIDPE